VVAILKDPIPSAHAWPHAAPEPGARCGVIRVPCFTYPISFSCSRVAFAAAQVDLDGEVSWVGGHRT
jgi:hypothetical protein